MKKYTLYILIQLLVLAPINTWSQNDSLIESRMTKQFITCWDVILNATEQLPILHKEGDIMMVVDMMKYWERKCNINQPLHTFKTLLDIEHFNFKEDDYLLRFLYEYNNANRTDSNLNGYYWYYNGYDYKQVVDENYYPYIKKWSSGLLALNKNYSDLEKFLLAFYANPSDSMIQEIQHLKGTALQENYQSHIKQSHKGQKFYAAFSAGSWFPTGRLRVLGIHPFIGMQLIHHEPTFDIYLDMQVRFLRAPNHFQAFKDDSLFTTNKHMGYYIGVGFNHGIWSHKRHKIDFLSGIGVDGLSFTLIDYKDDDETDLNKDLTTININAGLGYKFSLSKRKKISIGFDMKYHYLHYKNKGGTPMQGNAITVGLNIWFPGN